VENGHECHRRTRVGLRDNQVWSECSRYKTEDDVEKLCDTHIYIYSVNKTNGEREWGFTALRWVLQI
jgi:hypothetical protein